MLRHLGYAFFYTVVKMYKWDMCPLLIKKILREWSVSLFHEPALYEPKKEFEWLPLLSQS